MALFRRTKDWAHYWIMTPYRTVSHWCYKAHLRALIDFENAKNANQLDKLQEELERL